MAARTSSPPTVALFGALLFVLPVVLFADSPQSSGQQSSAASVPNDERYSVSGRVLDGERNPVAGSIIVPLDGSGVPLAPDGTPLTMQSLQQFGNDKSLALFTTTDEQGKFRIELLPGKYRLVAQSWPDHREPVVDLLHRHGSRLRVDGMVELEFQTEMQAADEILIRPIGSGAVRLRSQEAGDLVLISTEPLACDPLLGFMALTGTFWQGLTGGTAMDDDEILISGLPPGDVHFYSFVNDNNGGWGGASANVVEFQTTTVDLPLIAGWSNGHREPPPDLESLTNYFLEHPGESARVRETTDQLRQQYAPDGGYALDTDLHIKMSVHLRDDFELEDGRTISLAEAWAASGYARMKESDR